MQRSVTVTLLLRPSLFSFPQRETLLRQLETNQLDIDATLEELSVQQETEDQNYELYVTELSFLTAFGVPRVLASPSCGV